MANRFNKKMKPTLDEIETKMINYLKNINFKYYQDTFGYSKWQTVKEHTLGAYYGTSDGYSFSPKGVTLSNGENTKFIKAEQLKKIVEGGGEEQLRLF